MSTLSTIAIIAAILGLMYLAYKGWSIILIAPLLALVAAIGSGESFINILGNVYLVKAAEYIKNYFPIFLFGAVFAKIMEKGGLAASIADKIVEVLGPKRALLAVIIGCAVLTYGGLSVFVVAFVMYPFGAILFKRAGIPKRLLPAALWIGIFTFTMVALPGTPQIQNIIPSTYFGTSTWSGIGIGLFATVLYLAIGLGWLGYRSKHLMSRGEGYGNHTEAETEYVSTEKLPSWGISLIPLVTVIVLNIFINNPFKWNWITWNISSIWSITFATIVSSVLAVIIGREKLFASAADKKPNKEGFLKIINESSISSGTAVFNVASGYAFGCVITSVAGFGIISSMLMRLSANGNPLFSAVLSTSIMGGITGSASSGMTIALSKFGAQWAQMASVAGIPLDVLHRIVAISAIGIDPVPHCGALVTMFAICGLTHKESYFDIIVILLMKFFVPFLCVLFYMLTGIV
ncbi:MAG: GntP family permease [Treponema sp.]